MNKNITMRIRRFEYVKTSLLVFLITLFVVIACFIAILIIEKNYNKEVIPYSDLELYVACVYKNNFHYVNIFICWDDYETNTPYFFELSPKTHEQIKEYNINVNNLDYALNNLEYEIICNKPKFKTKVVLYK